MARTCLIALVLALSGCAAPEPFTAGAPVPAPHGWLDYCARNTNDHDCKDTETSTHGTR